MCGRCARFSERFSTVFNGFAAPCTALHLSGSGQAQGLAWALPITWLGLSPAQGLAAWPRIGPAWAHTAQPGHGLDPA